VTTADHGASEVTVTPTEFQARLDAAREGDDSAFVELFRSVQPALLRYLTTLGGGLAEDVASDTWVNVVRGLHKFRGDEKGWRSWVFTIAHSRLRDAQRQAARTPTPLDADELLRERPGRVDVGAEVEEMLSTEAALQLIGWLPPDQAEVVLLRHVAGLDVAHVAKVVGKRPGTVRVTAHRGLKRLAELLGARQTGTGQTGTGQTGTGQAGARQTGRDDAGCNGIEPRIGN
jgi:RNA polymerase sigma-70 factor (ECF subfamily)